MRWPCCSEATQGDSRTVETAGAMGLVWNTDCPVRAARSSVLGGPRGPCLTLEKPSLARRRPAPHTPHLSGSGGSPSWSSSGTG